MTNRTFLPCFAVCVLTMSGTRTVAQDDPMAVLKPLVGTWVTTVESRPSQANPEKSTGAGEITGKMILGGRFIELEGYGTSSQIGRQDFQVIMTYDERRRTYRRWVFGSDGVMAESKGDWNADKKTMTWSALGLPKTITITVTTRITQDGFEETLFGKRADGTVLRDITVSANKKR